MNVVCRQCCTPLDPWRHGRWISDRPDQTDIHGYQLSRLIMPSPPLEQMRLARNDTLTTCPENFYRQDIGVPWVREEDRLTRDDLDKCVGHWPFDDRAFWFRRVAMGVDVGTNLHMVIRGFFDGRWYLIGAFVRKHFEELDQDIMRFDVTMCVVDSQPEVRAARAFHQRHPDKVRLCLYTRQGLSAHWDFQDGVGYVRVDRTLAMDDWLYQFKSGDFRVPPGYRELADGDYLSQMLAPVRITRPNPFGHPVGVFENHKRPDHFAHAEVYATLATTRTGDVRPSWIDQSGRRVSFDGCHPDLRYRT